MIVFSGYAVAARRPRAGCIVLPTPAGQATLPAPVPTPDDRFAAGRAFR